MDMENTLNDFVKDQAYIEGWYACLRSANKFIIDELRKSKSQEIVNFGLDLTRNLLIEMPMKEREKNGNKII